MQLIRSLGNPVYNLTALQATLYPIFSTNTFCHQPKKLNPSKQLTDVRRKYEFSSTVKEFCYSKLQNASAFCIPPIAVHKVGKFITTLKNKNSIEPDNTTPYLLKIALPYNVESVTCVYHLCIEQNFPTVLKNAKVVPLPKTNDLSDPSNYRPISRHPVISKPLERYIHTHIFSSFTHPPVLSALLPIPSESRFHVQDFPLVVPVLFLSSTPLHGLTSHSSPKETLSGLQIQPQNISFSKARDSPCFPLSCLCPLSCLS